MTRAMLGELSWTELAELRDQLEIVLIPLGSTEQHGPNLGMGMDHISAEGFCVKVSERLHPRVLVAPAIPWGISPHHMKFPGTITLRPETFLAILEDLIGSLRHHGFRRFMLVNGHGGNEPLIAAAVRDLGFRLDIDFLGGIGYYNLGAEAQAGIKGPDMTGHACEVETARAFALSPHMIRSEALTIGAFDREFIAFYDKLRGQSLEWPAAIDSFSRIGSLGDARRATPEAGQLLVDEALSEFEDILDYLRTSLLRWNGPPQGKLHIFGDRK